MTWSAAEKFCVSKGGHLASVASQSHWQKLKDFIANYHRHHHSGIDIWLGGTDEGKEGDWSWTDGSKWSVEHWVSSSKQSDSKTNCLGFHASMWRDLPCIRSLHSICTVPTAKALESNTQLVFTAENISKTPAIQVRWVAQPVKGDEIRRQNVTEIDQQRNRELTDAQNKSQYSLTTSK